MTQSIEETADQASVPSGTELSGPFKSDPGWDEAAWWLWLPVLTVVAIAVIYRFQTEWYQSWMHPEGYGILELLHLFIPLAGMLICLTILARRWVYSYRLVAIWTALLALGCIYIAGEEHSWGQHFLYWQTPQYWKDLNAQDETNLHNVAHIFGKTPRLILGGMIFLGGIIIPIVMYLKPALRRTSLAVFLPANALIVTASLVTVAKVWDVLFKQGFVPTFATRISEVEELYIYLFILFYIIIFRRRLLEIERRT